MSAAAPDSDIAPGAAGAAGGRPVNGSGGGSVRHLLQPDQDVVFPSRQQYVAVVEGFRDSGFEMCSDLCAVDYLTHPPRRLPEGVAPERFEVVVNLLSLSQCKRVRVRLQVPGDDPVAPSLFSVYPGVEAMEREAFDLYGVLFDGHPDLTRILMPEDWEGHPLRKDYGVGRVPVQFKGAPGPR
ncbi:MAG TPA: NADH-quinone oxidoreductase subunit C [Acidimicrobiales bacterium]|nr:NADH-quinone oxidoreductase subunit C [Acidimicrobiales bacterium]